METIQANLDGAGEASPRQFASFREFYPYYLNEHSNRTCRRFHFVGTGLSFIAGGVSTLTLNPLWLAGAIVNAYTLAWIGHFAFEKNKPAAWKHFRLSFMGDWVMFYQILTGKIPF